MFAGSIEIQSCISCVWALLPTRRNPRVNQFMYESLNPRVQVVGHAAVCGTMFDRGRRSACAAVARKGQEPLKP